MSPFFFCLPSMLDAMSENIHSTVQSLGGICELAISARAGHWPSFWRVWECSPQAISLSSPTADIALNIVDYIGTDLKQPIPLRVDKDCWPNGTDLALYGAGLRVVTCMSADDGRRFLATLDELMSLGEIEKIVRAYDVRIDKGAVAIDRAAAYLKEIAATIADRDGDRLLMISS
jgi:hypothetical protein